jgi:hypothetical protein
MSLLYQNDVGVDLIIHTNNNLIPESATLNLLTEKPSGNTVSWGVTPLMIDYANGVITYTTVAGDLDEVGIYRLQVHGIFTDADEYSNIDTFTVRKRLFL